MASWNSIANCAKNSKRSKIKTGKKINRFGKRIVVSGFRDRMLKYLSSQGVSFTTEPTNAFLAKLCGEKLGCVFNITTADGVQELLSRLPDCQAVKKAMKPKRKAPNFYMSKAWRELRYQVLKENNGRCTLCGHGARDGMPLHVDHIFPRSKFPKLALEKTNLQVLCEDCNMGKSNKDTTDWRYRILAE